MTYHSFTDSPVGRLTLTSDGESLTGLFMTPHKHGPSVGGEWVERTDLPVFDQARKQLAAYFSGDLREFAIPLNPAGTPFQRQVWAELSRIPYGVTISYGELAKRIGRPGSSRAVGLANGRNPISIVVPCHRVIGASGKLTGYGGGIERKALLLDLERGGLGFGV